MIDLVLVFFSRRFNETVMKFTELLAAIWLLFPSCLRLSLPKPISFIQSMISLWLIRIILLCVHDVYRTPSALMFRFRIETNCCQLFQPNGLFQHLQWVREIEIVWSIELCDDYSIRSTLSCSSRSEIKRRYTSAAEILWIMINFRGWLSNGNRLTDLLCS